MSLVEWLSYAVAFVRATSRIRCRSPTFAASSHTPLRFALSFARTRSARAAGRANCQSDRRANRNSRSIPKISFDVSNLFVGVVVALVDRSYLCRRRFINAMQQWTTAMRWQRRVIIIDTWIQFWCIATKILATTGDSKVHIAQRRLSGVRIVP